MSLTQAGSNWGQPGSNSLELTRGSLPARPGMAEGCEFPPSATIWLTEGIYVTRALIHIEWCRWLGLGWPESSPASTLAVAWARVRSGSVLRCTGGRVSVCVRLLGVS